MKKEFFKNLSELIDKNFNSFLEKSNFKILSKKIEKNYINHLYINGNLYIKIEISLHPKDFPYYFNIILGDGDTNFPENDWNSIPLWKLAKISDKTSHAGYYTIKNLDEIQEYILEGLNDLKKFGNNFLDNELESFYDVRKKQNKNREPYKIYSKDKNGNLQFEYDTKSIKLKDKFS